jgi:succinate dehydrogenase / fumarate reductase cytochrome b subunit
MAFWRFPAAKKIPIQPERPPTTTSKIPTDIEPMPPQIERPLSPFMTYRWTLTMAMSIVHRITGMALYAGTLLLVWWLLATASGPSAYATFQGFIGSWFGRLILFGYTWALIHHLLGGARHLIWDLGYGFGPNEREWLTRAALIGSIALTIILWIVALAAGGLR